MPKRLDFDRLRKEYLKAKLYEGNVNDDPHDQFAEWMNDAIDSEDNLANAMVLSTVTARGTPDARVLLLKQFDQDGFIFVTNYESAKGRQLALRPFGCITFWWPELERQIRIHGKVEKLSSNENNDLFAARPRGSQLAAWSSNQSQVIESRDIIEKNVNDAKKEFANSEIPRPKFWGGYRLIADSFEFWQGRVNRLHDRIQFRKDRRQEWIMERLAP